MHVELNDFAENSIKRSEIFVDLQDLGEFTLKIAFGWNKCHM